MRAAAESKVAAEWAEEARLRAETTYSELHVARSLPLLLASAHVCSVVERIEAARAEIRTEREAAKHSGVVDKVVLYDAGQSIVAAERERKEVTANVAAALKSKPLACSNPVVAQVVESRACAVGAPDCFSLRGTVDAAVGWIDGRVDVPQLEAAARTLVSDAWAAHEGIARALGAELERSLKRAGARGGWRSINVLLDGFPYCPRGARGHLQHVS